MNLILVHRKTNKKEKKKKSRKWGKCYKYTYFCISVFRIRISHFKW